MVTWAIQDRISFGNKKLLILDVTDVAATAGSDFFPGWNRVDMVKAVNNTRTTDTFVEAVGSHAAATTKNKITLVAPTTLDDGHVWVWGR